MTIRELTAMVLRYRAALKAYDSHPSPANMAAALAAERALDHTLDHAIEHLKQTANRSRSTTSAFTPFPWWPH
jgi:hypothetical protein